MNYFQHNPLLTELSQGSQQGHGYKSQLQILLQQNMEYKTKCEALSILNTTLKQAMLNISKRAKIEPKVLEEIRQLSDKTNQNSRCQELKEYYDKQTKMFKQRHRREIQELDRRFDEQIELRRREIQKEYKDKLSIQRTQMVEQLRRYLEQQRNRIQKDLIQKSKQKSVKSSRVKNGLSNITKNKTLKSPKVSFLDESTKENFRTNLQCQKTMTTQGSTARHPKKMLKQKSQQKFINLKQNKQHERKPSTTLYTKTNVSSITSLHGTEEINNVYVQDEKTKLMNELMKRKQEIEVQLEKIVNRKGGKQKQLQSVLETDLDQIVYVINNNGDLSVSEIEEILYGARSGIEFKQFEKKGIGKGKERRIQVVEQFR